MIQRWIVISLTAAAGILLLLINGCESRQEDWTRQREVLPFSLKDSHDRTFAQANLTGKVSIVSFFLSSCVASSVGVSGRMAEIQKRCASLPDVQLLSLTVDPQGDTPATLREYGQKYGADTNRWFFLTGSRRDLHSLIKKSFLSDKAIEKYQRTGYDPMLDQCDLLVVVDQEGWVRGWFDGTRFSTVERVMELVKYLRPESNSKR